MACGVSGMEGDAGAGLTSPIPYQHGAVLIDGKVVDRDQFLFEGLQRLLIQLKLDLQRPVGDPRPRCLRRTWTLSSTS